jgi:hypothetical protein
LLCACGASFDANSATVKYTFSGTVESIRDNFGNDDGVLTAADGITIDNSKTSVSVGDAVQYVFLVDFEEDGFYEVQDGSIVTLTDSATRDYFFTDLVSGSLISTEPSVASKTGETMEYNYGFETSSSSRLITDSVIDLTTLYLDAILLSELEVGNSAEVAETALITAGFTASVRSALTLTDITQVPIPASAWLLFSTIAGTFGFGHLSARRRRQA